MDVVRALASCVFLVIVLGEGSKIERSSLVGDSISLACSLPHSKPAKIVWNDQVYTPTAQPIIIFQSENNPTFMISERHPNKANFEIDRRTYQLKISNLSFDSSGDYSCISQSDGRTHVVHYSLTVHDRQYCRGETHLQDGQNTSLTCRVHYSGNQPTMTWHGETGAIQAISIDRSDLTEDGPVGEQELQLKATHEMDDKVVTCRMDFGDANQTCPFRFNVTYAVRDVAFSAVSNTVYVGEEVRCTARGNPRPYISVVPIVSGEDHPAAQADSRIVIPKSWEGRELMLKCTANNTYKGKQRSVTKTVTLQVLAATTTTTVATTTPTTMKPTPKPTEPAKPVVDDKNNNNNNNNNNGAGRGVSESITLVFVAMSFALRTALSRRC